MGTFFGIFWRFDSLQSVFPGLQLEKVPVVLDRAQGLCLGFAKYFIPQPLDWCIRQTRSDTKWAVQPHSEISDLI